MKKKILLFQKDWSSTIVNFLIDEKLNAGFLPILKIINETYAKENYVGMNHIFKDVNSFYADIDSQKKEKLNLILKGRFGFSFDELEISDINRIIKIFTKGKINNLQDYNFVKEFIDANYNIYNPGFIYELNLLLNNYCR